MNYGDKEIKRAIRKKRSDIHLEDIVKSKAFKDYITSGMLALFKKHKRNPNLEYVVYYDEADQTTAKTDNKKIIVNAANSLFTKRDDLDEPLSVSVDHILGVMLHEAGHVLYTNFSVLRKYKEQFRKGELIVSSIELSKEEKRSLKEINNLLNDNKSNVVLGVSLTKTKAFIYNIFDWLNNAVEDGRIESILLDKDADFGGYCNGLIGLRNKQKDEIVGSNIQDIEKYLNACFEYAKYGISTTYTGDVFPELEEAKPIIDIMLDCKEAMKFTEYTVELICIAYPNLIKPLLTDQTDDQSDDDQSNDNSQGDSSSNDENSDTDKSSDGQSGSENNKSKGNSEDNGSNGDSSNEESNEDENEDSGNQDDSTDGDSSDDQDDSNKEDELDDIMNNLPETSVMPEYDNMGVESSDGDLEESMQPTPDFVGEAAREEVEEEINGEINKMISDSTAPLGCSRVTVIDDLPYASLSPNQDAFLNNNRSLFKKVGREIENHLKSDMRTGSNKRKFSGKKFRAEKLVNRDYRYFENTATKRDIPETAIGILIDQSGSMYGEQIRCATYAAMGMYKTLAELEHFDVAVYGHTSTYDEVIINRYIDFGFKPNDPIKVLAGIYSDGGNIDEVAVTALGERLKSQMVDKKIMIIISDGLPHSMIGHAETRLRDLVKEYVKGGFNVFVAALGSDKAKIDKIYEDVSFIDITDPSELPTNMLRAIKRTI
jgi:uncharacterized protein with von Willebrand factor type A (vWA) domain